MNKTTSKISIRKFTIIFGKNQQLQDVLCGSAGVCDAGGLSQKHSEDNVSNKQHVQERAQKDSF